MDIKYHYTSCEGLMGIDSMELHCSRIDFLNDPSETSYYDTLLEEVLSDHNCKAIYDGLFSQSYADFCTHTVYIASFCLNDDLFPMWKHYSKGNGCCIGVDIDQIIEENKRPSMYIEKKEILYDSDRQKELLFDLIMSFNERFISVNVLNKVYTDTNDFGEEIVLGTDMDRLSIEFTNNIIGNKYNFKHSAYKDESEIRLIIHIDDCSRMDNLDEIERYKISPNEVIVEYIPLKIPSKDTFVSLTAHPQGSQLHELGIKHYIKNKLGYEFLKKYCKSSIPFKYV